MSVSFKMWSWTLHYPCCLLLFQPAGSLRLLKITNCEVFMLTVTWKMFPGAIIEVGFPCMSVFILQWVVSLLSRIKQHKFKSSFTLP